MKSLIKPLISLILCAVIVFQPFAVSAASSSGKTYVKEMILSYGNTEDDAKNWLTDNGYTVLNYNLNEGADDTWSTKRAVYLGYTTTNDVDEAVTDMRLMNMKGGYSVQDYQLLLEEQKTNIRLFLDDFIIAVNEFRNNYNKGQSRALSAYKMLNLLYDDDTQQYMGDLLLNKIKEEYTDDEFSALSSDVQSKTADMTTILMQANANSVLAIEQLIALAADDGDSLWTDRYSEAGTYDDMLDSLITEKRLTVNQAEKELASEYDEDAKSLQSKFEGYKSYLESYTSVSITLSSTQEEIDAYKNANEDFDYVNWFTAGTQYEVMRVLENDDGSLLDLVTGDEYDVANEDRCMLYPLIASLTKGQRACLDFLSMFQIMALGINTDESVKSAVDSLSADVTNEIKSSIYNGVDRTIFGNDVALTNEAYRLQNSTGKDAMSNWSEPISSTTLILAGVFGVTAIAMTACWVSGPMLTKLITRLGKDQAYYASQADFFNQEATNALVEATAEANKETAADYTNKAEKALRSIGTAKTLQKVLYYAGIVTTAATIILFAVSLWSTYEDLKEYYNAEFTPIPMHMVNESVNENDEKVFTYYTAVKCNRQDVGMVTDKTEILKDFGDLNGDVGRQWVALYTTKDRAAGYPLTADFTVQYENTNIPGKKTALSMFGENAVQNLTNSKLGYTYSDSRNGIYMFYAADTSAYAGSAFSSATYALFGGGTVAVLAAVAAVITKLIKKKRDKSNTPASA